MKLAELQKKIADVLGVSASQKELSFEIFVDKISEILHEHVTIKVPRVGYFQLKIGSLKNGNRPLIFSPLSEDISRETRNLYLTIEVAPKVKNTPEFDSNIFSIGVGKPLLPLSIDELPDTETSYAMLKKSIEERVKELLMESDQIPNFNIWDDYYKSPEDYESEPEDGTKVQLFELTSDLAFNEEIIPDRIPENISDNYNLTSYESDQTPQLDYGDLFLEVNKSNEPKIDYGESLGKIDEELATDSLEILFPPYEEPDIVTVIEKTPEEENYSALQDLQLDEISSNTITISDLLDDTTHSFRDDLVAIDDENKTEESVVPIEDVMTRMLNEDPVEDTVPELLSKDITEDRFAEQPTEKKLEEHNRDESEITTDYMPDHKKSLFDELHELSKEVEPSQENEQDAFEKMLDDDEKEKIEWNWGDELREEFGLPNIEQGEEKFEIEPDYEEGKKGDLKLVDDFLDDERTTQDLFSRLEKTLEREFNYDAEPNHRLTVEDKKPTLDRNKLKKVVMEFSGPPAKYEFIEDRPSERERRMAISLVDESGIKKTKKTSATDEEIIEQGKNSYFGKMFFFILGAFIVIAVVILFFKIYGNNNNQINEAKKSVEQGQKNTSSDSDNVATIGQSNPAKNDSSALSYDDLTDFPRTATAPVPIKDATDKQILETIKNEKAKLQSNKVEEKPVVKQPEVKPQNQGLYKTVTTDTKVSNRVFSDGKNFYLQVSSWPNRLRAEEEVNRLRTLGFNGFIIEANLPKKGGMWYRVRVGPFKTENETTEFMKKNNL